MKFGWITVVMAAVAATPALADELVIRPALGYAAALEALKASYETATGDTIKIAGANDAADLVIVAKQQVEAQVKDGKMEAASATDIAEMRIGFAVKAGAPKPDISTPEKLKEVLLKAKSVGVSAFVSGQFVSGELFPKLGIADQMKTKTVVVKAGPVGEAVAKGEAEVGFQQMSELLPIKGIAVVGPIPDSVQRVTVLTAGIAPGAKARAAAARFVAYVKSPAAAAAHKSMDLAPVK